MATDVCPSVIHPEVQLVVKAGFWRRYWALLLDGLIIEVCLLAVFAATSALSLVGPELYSEQWWLIYLSPLALFAVGSALYFIWPYSHGGQTLGKRALGIRVVAIDGSPLNWRKGLLRYLGYGPSGMILYLGYLWSIRDPDKQAWHDKIAGTTVIRDSGQWRHQRPVLVDPAVARRRQRRWLLRLGIPYVLLTLAAGGWLSSFTQSGIAEVRAMEPWPDDRTTLEEAVAADLTHLGLRIQQVQDLQQEGTLVLYEDGEDEAVLHIRGLRFETSEDAATFSPGRATGCGASVERLPGPTWTTRAWQPVEGRRATRRYFGTATRWWKSRHPGKWARPRQRQLTKSATPSRLTGRRWRWPVSRRESTPTLEVIENVAVSRDAE